MAAIISTAKPEAWCVYPSQRRSGGTCLVALVPHAVQSVMQGRIIRLAWAGHPGPRVSEIDQAKDA